MLKAGVKKKVAFLGADSAEHPRAGCSRQYYELKSDSWHLCLAAGASKRVWSVSFGIHRCLFLVKLKNLQNIQNNKVGQPSHTKSARFFKSKMRSDKYILQNIVLEDGSNGKMGHIWPSGLKFDFSLSDCFPRLAVDIGRSTTWWVRTFVCRL